MITVTARREKSSGRIAALEATGHSGYAPEGSDIVCAAVSALMQALAVGLFEVLELDSDEIVFETDSGRIQMRASGLDRAGDSRVDVLAETIYRSLRGVASAYGDYVRVEEEFI